MFSQEFHAPQKLLAVDLVYEPQILLRTEIEEESEAVVLSSQCFFALALLIFTLEKLKIGEPLMDSVGDFRATRFVLVLNNGHVCSESLKICLLAVSGGDCLIEVVANGFPRTGAVGQRIPQEIRTGEIRRSAPTSEIDFLVPPSFAPANLPIKCDCHIASSAYNAPEAK
jgi:hypothetical protein